MDCVWKLKGPGAGAAGTSPFSGRADSVDMLLGGRRMLRGVSGLRRAALGSRPPMSFQLAVLLVALERESGRSREQSSRSISMSASGSTSTSSGGGSMRRGGVGEGGGRADDRPEAMCLSRTANRHGEGGTRADLLSL